MLNTSSFWWGCATWGWSLCVVVLLTVAPARADEPVSGNTYAEMDLDQLMSIQVESVAGVDTDWLSTPAAISVLDSDDIARSGHQFLAELLRDLPGVHVGRINSHEWAVSARGFNDYLANKLQVVIDGQEVYDPIFAGVRWKLRDLILDDIDQIEVIRGPGATLWGANAVNGVVNIKTKSAKDTQGLYVKQVVGTELRDITSVRYGGKIDDDTYYRVWSKYVNYDAGVPPAGTGQFDDWRMGMAGFRLDREGADNTDLMLQGRGFYTDQIGRRETIPGAIPYTSDMLNGDAPFRGGSLTARLKNQSPDGEGWSTTGFVDYFNRRFLSGLDESVFFGGFDWRHHFRVGQRHNLIWGAGYRLTYYDYDRITIVSFDPPTDTLHIASGFVQDTITLEPDRWFVMLGSKFEHNELSGFEVQPSARLWWTPSDHQTLWAAVSRPVRRPDLAEKRLEASIINTGLPAPNDQLRLVGASRDAETVLAWEMGYRHRFGDTLTFDIAGFYNQYDKLVTGVSQGFNIVYQNAAEADSYGLETAVHWRAADNLQFTASHSALVIDARGTGAADLEDAAASHQVKLRTDYDLTGSLALHGALYYTDDAGTGIPAYWRLDTGLTWQINNQVDLSVWGQNLLDSHHPEFATDIATPTETERSVYVQLRCRF